MGLPQHTAMLRLFRRHFGRRLSIVFIKNDLYIPDLYAGTETTTHGLCTELVRRNHRAAVAAVSRSLAGGAMDTGRVNQSMVLGYPVFTAPNFECAVAEAIKVAKPDLVVF